jgi:2-isopropylmalate synthase
MSNARITVFDTTLRDGEQSPGCSMNTQEKVRLALQLDRLGVDVIEAGFPIASDGDFAAVKSVAAAVPRPIIAALARAAKHDIERAAQALEAAVRPRIHVFLATSDIHLTHKLRISRQQCLEQARDMVRYAKTLCNDVEFESGATTLNIPDTVGYTVPSEFGALIQSIRQRVRGVEKAVISAHCHNDLGLGVANSLAAIAAGARQVECTINGIGERAGNASLEEIVMACRVRADQYPYETGIATEQLYPTSQMLEEITGIAVQPNKAVIGRNAFAHEAGIHQDGMLKNPLTYEIMTPKSVGVPDSKLVLGKHSGRHALSLRCEQLGYRFERRELDEIYRRFVVLADEVKHVHDHQLLALIREAYGEEHRIPPGRVEAERAKAAVGGDESRRIYPGGVPTDYSAASLPPTPPVEHQTEQEDYLWGV